MDTIWQELDKLPCEQRYNGAVALQNDLGQTQSEMRKERPLIADTNRFGTTKPCVSGSHVQIRIEVVIIDLLKSISRKEFPHLNYSNRIHWNNVRFQKGIGLELKEVPTKTWVRFESLNQIHRLALTLKILAHMYKLIESNTFSTKRDLFYQDPVLFRTQAVVDEIVDNISCMLKVPRWNLHVLATSKGCVAGDLKYMESDGNYVDCTNTKSGFLVPSHVEGITNLQSTARFVLVVEKDATFQKLLSEGICDKLKPCIVITGKGFPDLNTRLMVRKLWEVLHIPTMALVDCDPHGIEIMLIYKFGSRSMSFEAANLTLPSLKWLGVCPTDLKSLNIPKDGLIPTKASDQRRICDLLKRPYIDEVPQIRKELELMLEMGWKAEIQCLNLLSDTYLTDVYIKNKLSQGQWL